MERSVPAELSPPEPWGSVPCTTFMVLLLREVKPLAGGLITCKWQSHDLDPGFPVLSGTSQSALPHTVTGPALSHPPTSLIL